MKRCDSRVLTDGWRSDSRTPHHRSDQGSTLVGVIGLMAVAAILISVMVFATLQSVGTTTATRAEVQSRAAAQSGIDAARSVIASKTCSSPTVSGFTPSGDSYTVTIHPSNSSTAGATTPAACPSAGSRAIYLKATGTAGASGFGNKRGDISEMDALISKSVDPPRFNSAAFGYSNVTLRTNMQVIDTTGANTADVITGNNFSCETNMLIEGNVHTKGNASFNSAPCRVKGDVLVGKDFVCAAGTTIGGNLYVTGNARFTSSGCEILGTVHVKGNVDMQSPNMKLGSELLIGGNFSLSDQPSTSVASIRIKGTLVESWAAGQLRLRMGSALVERANVSDPPAFDDDILNQFPKIQTNDSEFATWAPRDLISDLRSIINSGTHNWMRDNPCQSLGSWATNAFTSNLIITQKTRYDVTSACNPSLTLGSNLVIDLRADAVIFASQIIQNGNFTVKSGDGLKHTLYIVSPWKATQTSCITNGAGGIVLSSGSLSQPTGNLGSVLFYAASPITVHYSAQIYGQIYACQVEANTGTVLNFTPSNAASNPDLVPWALQHIRDVP